MMAKEFKDYDHAFSATQIAECRHAWLEGFLRANAIVKWDIRVDAWSNETIRNCVYFAEGAEDWQLFRVSMKGLTTVEKLYMLRQRYEFGGDEARRKIEKCRIDNYIGALKRGGQLNINLEIVK